MFGVVTPRESENSLTKSQSSRVYEQAYRVAVQVAGEHSKQREDKSALGQCSNRQVSLAMIHSIDCVCACAR